MSHVIANENEIMEKDLKYLKEAAEELGLVFNQGQKNWKWYGNYMDDYAAEDAAYRRGVSPKEYGKCEHAISVPGNKNAYEVGVAKQESGNYKLLFDFWNGGYGLCDHIGAKGEKLLQKFGEKKLVSEAKNNGFNVENLSVRPDGHIEVTMSKPNFGGSGSVGKLF